MIYFVVNKANVLIKTEENNIYLIGAIYYGDDHIFEHYFSELESKHNEIKVHIHTEGGSVFAGNYIQNRIKASESVTDIIVMGSAFSMGAIILAAGKSKKRSMVRNGFIMIHSASDYSGGNKEELKDTIKLLEQIDSNFILDLIEITGKSKKEVSKWLKKDTYFSAEQALKAGLINEIIDPMVELDTTDAKGSYSRFTALLTKDYKKADTTIDKSKLNSNTMKQPIIAKLQLTSVTAESSDTAVVNAVEAHYNAKYQALENKYNAEKSAHKILKDTIEASREKEISAFLAPLEKTHKKEQIEAYRSIAKNNGIDTLKAVLGTSPRTPVADLITKDPADATTVGAKKDWNWDKYQKEDPKALEALQRTNLEAFKAIYKAKFGKEYVK